MMHDIISIHQSADAPLGSRELLQRGGNVRAVMRDPDANRKDLEELITYFPRGKRGKLQVNLHVVFFAGTDTLRSETPQAP